MRKVVINRAVDTQRMAAFSAFNSHVPGIERVEAVNGQEISLVTLVERGVAEPGLAYTQGAIGAALSHLKMWSLAIQENVPLTIFEDDAMLCRNFDSESARLIHSLPADWDVVLWGYNFNAPITIEALSGITRGVVTFDEERMRHNAHAFGSLECHAALFPLLQGFGLCSYTVSPRGARLLLECCLPLRAQEYQQLGLDRMVRNVGIDVVTSYHFARLNAFAALSPLAIVRNDKKRSTTKRPLCEGQGDKCVSGREDQPMGYQPLASF